MPITRSQQGSAPPSESGHETPGGMTEAEIEILNNRIAEKEKMLREQAEALRHRQEELENLRQDISMSRESSEITFRERMQDVEQKLSMLADLPDQMEYLKSQVADIQIPTGRDTPTGLFERNNTQRNCEQSPIRLKDAIDSIPRYDGHKMSVFQFCKMCERALSLIPNYHEFHLVQLIINKLHGHAYAAVEGTDFSTVFALTRRLKEVFGPNKSTDQYRGELANIFMKSNEHILDYVERVKELKTSILDGEMTETGYINGTVQYRIEQNAKESFINGLPSDLLIRVKLERPGSLEDAVVCAIQLTKTLEAENSRKRPVIYKSAPLYRADMQNNSRVSNTVRFTDEQPTYKPRNAPFIKPLIPGQSGPNGPIRVCFNCKAPGHFIRECPKLAYRTRGFEGESRNNNQGNTTSIPMTGVHRNVTQEERPSTSVMILHKEDKLPLHTSPN